MAEEEEVADGEDVTEEVDDVGMLAGNTARPWLGLVGTQGTTPQEGASPCGPRSRSAEPGSITRSSLAIRIAQASSGALHQGEGAGQGPPLRTLSSQLSRSPTDSCRP